eukprot:12603-Heterococcus_DN1.PRE.1
MSMPMLTLTRTGASSKLVEVGELDCLRPCRLPLATSVAVRAAAAAFSSMCCCDSYSGGSSDSYSAAQREQQSDKHLGVDIYYRCCVIGIVVLKIQAQFRLCSSKAGNAKPPTVNTIKY